MATRSRTFTERMRREQLIEVTIRQLADLGYARTSLARIAEGAGISKAAVLYHFATKEAVVAAAYRAVLDALVAEVAEAVERAGPADRPAVYTSTMIAHLARRPRHAHVLIEALTHRAASPEPHQRWEPVATLLQDARAARDLAPLPDARTASLALGGMIDAVLAESLHDPGYSVTGATVTVLDWLALVLGDPATPG